MQLRPHPHPRHVITGTTYVLLPGLLTPSSCFLSIVRIQHKLRQELRVCLAALGPHRTTKSSEGQLHLTAIGHKPRLWAQDACIHLPSRYLHLDASQASHTSSFTTEMLMLTPPNPSHQRLCPPPRPTSPTSKSCQVSLQFLCPVHPFLSISTATTVCSLNLCNHFLFSQLPPLPFYNPFSQSGQNGPCSNFQWFPFCSLSGRGEKRR